MEYEMKMLHPDFKSLEKVLTPVVEKILGLLTVSLKNT